ncbi:hypothetical protein GCM10025867_35670 [Frondihabitans sucicola]|uniref:DUF7134 domain-containing protein n=1 Tax=Frondihabitans sucicola TaxID=1268041 RepID=A0ABM8GS88_9MICO|nr:hypothetical protein [Frondihabitans sucicola]BDZ51326.1 hypothetical protein GCM10025867_35670 [Frondihabitans sucicola]
MKHDWARTFSSRVFRVDLITGLVLAVLGLVPGWLDLTQPHLSTVVLAVVATALRRSTPGIALGVTWVMAVSQIWLGERPSLIAVTYILVLYAVARVGNRWEGFAGGVSVVFGGIIASFYLYRTGARFTEFAYGSPAQTIVVLLAPPAVLGFAWLAGLTVRFFRSRGDESELRIVAETEAHRALDLAAEERARTTMARDVHDIVGHSSPSSSPRPTRWSSWTTPTASEKSTPPSPRPRGGRCARSATSSAARRRARPKASPRISRHWSSRSGRRASSSSTNRGANGGFSIPLVRWSCAGSSRRC